MCGLLSTLFALHEIFSMSARGCYIVSLDLHPRSLLFDDAPAGFALRRFPFDAIAGFEFA